MESNRILEREVKQIMNRMAMKIPKELEDFGGVICNGIKLLSRENKHIPKSDKRGVAWLMEVVTFSLCQALEEMKPQEVAALCNKLIDVSHETLTTLEKEVAANAIKEGEVKKDDSSKHKNRNQGGEETCTGNCNSLQHGGEK